MRSHLSSIVADIILQDLESTVLNKLTINLPFYVRYIDDIAFEIDRSINDIVEAFINYNPRLKFTLEEGGDRINFLDVTLIKKKHYL